MAKELCSEVHVISPIGSAGCRKPSLDRGARPRCMLAEHTGLTTTRRSRPSMPLENKKEAETHASMVSASFLFSTDASAPVAYSLLSLVHSLLSKFEPCKSENRVPQPLAPLCGSQTVRHSPVRNKMRVSFLGCEHPESPLIFYFAWLKAYSYSISATISCIHIVRATSYLVWIFCQIRLIRFVSESFVDDLETFK